MDTEWKYDTAPDIDKDFYERLRSFPREPDMLVYGFRLLGAALMRLWLKIYHRLEIEGGSRLAMEGSFIMVSNHTSHLDALGLISALPAQRIHRIFPAAAEDYFFRKVHRVFFTAIFVNAIPFSRSKSARNSIGICRALLQNPGNILVIFPEGTRSTDGRIGSFKPGIGVLAAGLDVPVFPCAVKGAFEAWPKGRLFPFPKKVKIVVGEPLNFKDFNADRESCEKISETLKLKVEELLCQGG